MADRRIPTRADIDATRWPHDLNQGPSFWQFESNLGQVWIAQVFVDRRGVVQAAIQPGGRTVRADDPEFRRWIGPVDHVPKPWPETEGAR